MLLAMGVLIGIGAAASAAVTVCLWRPVEHKDPKYQQIADSSSWRWSDAEADVNYSVSRAGRRYKIDLIPIGRDPLGGLTIRFSYGGRVVYTWNGYRYSVFVVKGSELVYARYENASDGCMLIAVDLNTGTELWHHWLEGVGEHAHSMYINRVEMALYDERTAIIYGEESFGRYVELVDLKTGRTLGHKIFPQEPPSQPTE